MNTTNTTNVNNSHSYFVDILTEQNWNLFICLPLAFLYLVVTGNIWKIHRYSLEPIHIFELNILASAALLFINNSLFGFDPHFHSINFYCGVVHFLDLYNKFSFYIGIISSQLDRFLALYWNVSYKGRVTPELAMKILLFEKVLILVVLLLFCMFDSPALQCYHSPVLLCQESVRSVTRDFARVVFWIMIAAVISVSLYVLNIKVRSSRQVQPTVNLPAISGQEIPTISRELTSVMEADVVLQDVDETNQVGLEEEEADDDGQMADVPKIETSLQMVQRQNPDPFMFYRIKSLKVSSPDKIETMTCLPNKWSLVDNTPRAVSFNLVSLCLLIMLIPTKLQDLYFYFSQGQCDGGAAVQLSRLLSAIELLTALIYPFIIKSKLKHQN